MRRTRTDARSKSNNKNTAKLKSLWVEQTNRRRNPRHIRMLGKRRCRQALLGRPVPSPSRACGIISCYKRRFREDCATPEVGSGSKSPCCSTTSSTVAVEFLAMDCSSGYPLHQLSPMGEVEKSNLVENGRFKIATCGGVKSVSRILSGSHIRSSP